MFGFFKKKEQQGVKITCKVLGMHCTSCAMNIDDALEELEGVYSADTNYAKGEVKVSFDDSLVSASDITRVIQQQGYDTLPRI